MGGRLLFGHRGHRVLSCLYSVDGFLHLGCVVVVGASCLDYLDREIDLLPIRLIAVIAAMAFVLVLRPPVNSDVRLIPRSDTASPDFDGYSQLEARLRSIPEDQPVVMVAASGGGSRAAIFTALVFEFLARRPLSLTASTNEIGDVAQRYWADNIILISSVSGGSLATAHFVHRDCRKSKMQPTTHCTIRDELVARVGDSIRALASQHSGAEFERAKKRAEKMLSSIEKGPSETSSTDAWVIYSGFVDAMCMNFMAPTLRGAGTLGVGRGHALGRFWEDMFGWQGSSNVQGFLPAGGAEGNRVIPSSRPLVVFNACDVAKGSRIAIGIPPLP